MTQTQREKTAQAQEARGNHDLATANRMTHDELIMFAAYISGRSPRFFAEAVAAATGRGQVAS